MRIFMIAGTSEAAELIKELSIDHEVTASFATHHGKTSLHNNRRLHILTEKMTYGKMVDVFKHLHPDLIVDASHPFAEIVSQNAKKAAQTAGIEYIRFERPYRMYDYDKISYANTYEEAAKMGDQIKGNLLLLTGSKTLEIFKENIKDFVNRCYVRVLPDSCIIKKCENLGLDSKHMIAMRGPFSVDMNTSLIKHVKAQCMITKDTGTNGGMDEKMEAVRQEQMDVIMIKRPDVNTNNVLYNIEHMVEYVKKKELYYANPQDDHSRNP